MLFNSFAFLVFLCAVVLAWALTPGRWRWATLLAASLVFYAYGDPIYLVQALLATALAFVVGGRLERTADKEQRRRLLTIAIVALAANLLAFKYAAFFNESLRSVFALMGVEYAVPAFHPLLPIGISFYTFQLIGYLVDVYRGQAAERHPGIFALFVLFFPKLVAGPIERTRTLLPQLHVAQRFDHARVVTGLQLMLWGYFKKVVVADRIAPFVARVYDDPTTTDGPLTALTTGLYAFQLYCDFSGYTDIALGVAAIFGYTLVRNFNRPYLATSIQDYWKRWHISLSSWLTDYLYTPLTRQKRVKIKFYRMMLLAMFLTFAISGFWHGAQWTFVLWGVLHGLYVVTSLQSQKLRATITRRIGLASRPRLHHAVRVGLTFLLVCGAYLLFRANSPGDAWRLATSLGHGWGSAASSILNFVYPAQSAFLLALLGIGTVLAVEQYAAAPAIRRRFEQSWSVRWATYASALLAITVLGAYYGQAQKFIYFRF